MVALNKVYELIGKGEHDISEDKIPDAIKYYKEANKELTDILAGLKENKSSNEAIVDSVALLKTNISQVIFDLSNLTQEQKKPSATNEIVNGSIIKPRKMIGESFNFTTTLEQDLDKLSPENDSLLNMIMNKLQKNLIETSKLPGTTNKLQDEKEQITNRHIEQFKRELIWYEKKKFSQYDIDLIASTKENAKLKRQVEKLKDRWNNLVESARQKRDHQ